MMFDEDLYSELSADEEGHAADDVGADLHSEHETKYDFGNDDELDGEDGQSAPSSSNATSRRHRGSRGSGQKNKK